MLRALCSMEFSMVRSSCLLLLLALCSALRGLLADGAKNSAVVVGTVYCDTCFQRESSKSGHFISGATVAVECGGDGATEAKFRREARTDRRGVFRVRLPPEFSKNVEQIQACSVELIRSNEPFCAVASSTTSSRGLLRLKSKRKGLQVYSAGLFSFKPLKTPEPCHQEPRTVSYSKAEAFAEAQKRAQPAFFFPPIPFVPSPPNIGGIPLPPNPLLPPPSLIPPVIPSPPSSVLPPVFPSPPPSFLPPVPNLPIPPVPNLPAPNLPTPNLPLPPVPFLSPPSLPPPAFIFPPLPFPFPGIPPHQAEAKP